MMIRLLSHCDTTITSSFISLACAEFDDSLPFSGASSIPLCYVLFPATLLLQLFFHPLSSHLFLGLPLNNLVVPKFIYNTLLGILFSFILCTCPNQHNLFNIIVSIIEADMSIYFTKCFKFVNFDLQNEI